MNTYESIFVTRPSLSEKELGRIHDKIRTIIEKNGGAVLKSEDWGKRKLAYEVGKEKKGAYLLYQLRGDGKLVKDLEKLSAVEDDLIRFLIVRMNRTPEPASPTPQDPSGSQQEEAKGETESGQLQ